MRVIAHRANIGGPNSRTENSPAQILRAIEQGFDVEIDTRVIDGQIFFGHDYPQYECPESLIIRIIEKGWFHCKNLEAMTYLSKHFPGIKYFWHQSDDFTLTSNGFIWTYPGQKITNKSVLVLPENIDPFILQEMWAQNPHAVCSDWPEKYVFGK